MAAWLLLIMIHYAGCFGWISIVSFRIFSQVCGEGAPERRSFSNGTVILTCCLTCSSFFRAKTQSELFFVSRWIMTSVVFCIFHDKDTSPSIVCQSSRRIPADLAMAGVTVAKKVKRGAKKHSTWKIAIEDCNNTQPSFGGLLGSK